MPITIHERNGIRGTPFCSMIDIPSKLIELPAGVPTPPINEPIGMPSMTALPKFDPGLMPIFWKIPSAMAMKIAAHGTSEMIVERSPVPIIITERTRFVPVPAFEIIHKANLRASPVFIQARAMMNMARTKKNTGLMKLTAAGPNGLILRIG